MTPLRFSVRADLFRIVARFAARTSFVLDISPPLAGVRLEPSADGGVIVSACNGLTAFFVRDSGGRVSRPATMQRPDQASSLIRDAARNRLSDVYDAAATPRLIFNDGACSIDEEPHIELLISEIGGDYPPYRDHVPMRALKAAADIPADVGESLAIAARQLASAAGYDLEDARTARFSTYREPFGENGGFTLVRFSASPEAFALIAPDGATHPAPAPAWAMPPWLEISTLARIA